MMKFDKIFKYGLLGICASPMAVAAQIELSDKLNSEVDLGYGVASTEYLTTAAVTTITAEELQRTPAISLADALYGKLLGLTATQGTGFKGDEGAGASFSIRGVQTAGETGILILVDGFERPIDRLSVEEVESVTVLRDAAAVAMYGHEAINGVLLVKTKRGRNDNSNHLKAGYSHKWQFDPQTADMTGAGGYPDADCNTEALGNVAHESHAYVSLLGGNDKVRYYTQLDYTDARGLDMSDGQGGSNPRLRYAKANIRANVDLRLSQTTKASADLLAIFMNTHGLPSTDFRKNRQRQIWADVHLDQDLGMIADGLAFYAGASYDNSSNTVKQNVMGYLYGCHDACGNPSQGAPDDNLGFGLWADKLWRIATMNVGLKYGTRFGYRDHLAANLNYNIKSEARYNKTANWHRSNWQLAMHYDHQESLMADLVLAANGSGRSCADKWAFSPTLGLGWVLCSNNDCGAAFNYAKLRVSAGIQHTDYVPEAGLWHIALATGDMCQETAYKFNIGADMRIANRVDLTVDYYNQKRANILVGTCWLNSSAAGVQLDCDGKGTVNSQGVEVGARYARTFSSGLNINTNFMLAYNKSEVQSWIGSPAINYAFSIGAEHKGFGINATLQGAGCQAKCLWYSDVRWLKMRDCEIYYRHGDFLRFFVQGQNLLSWDNVGALDAETPCARYPVMKSVSVGMSVQF